MVSFTSRREINIVDLGLITPDGKQVGASGADKLSIFVSETRATPGYHPCKLVPGEWQIIVGAYKVAQAGVDVCYELSFTPKHMRLFKGDLHTHTLASDGVLNVEELSLHAQQEWPELSCHHRPQHDGSNHYPARTSSSNLDTRDRVDPLPGARQLPGSGSALR